MICVCETDLKVVGNREMRLQQNQRNRRCEKNVVRSIKEGRVKRLDGECWPWNTEKGRRRWTKNIVQVRRPSPVSTKVRDEGNANAIYGARPQ